MAWVLFVIFVLVGIPIFGYLYAHAIRYSPLVYLSFIITVIYGSFCGGLASFAVYYGKVRNPIIGLSFSLFAAFVGWYVQWAVWLALIAGKDNFADMNVSLMLALDPSKIMEGMGIVSETGAWSIGGSGAVTGLFLWLVWLCEFVLIMVMAWIVTSSQANSPFDEVLGKWTTDLELPLLITPINDKEFQDLKYKMENGDYEDFYRLRQVDGYAGIHTILKLNFCEGSDVRYLTLIQRTLAPDNNGEIKNEDKNMFEYMILNKTVIDTFVERTTTPLPGDEVEEV